MVFFSFFRVKDPLHQGWCDGSLHFCISCTCGFLWPSCCAACCWSSWSPDPASMLGCRHSKDSLFFIGFFAGFGKPWQLLCSNTGVQFRWLTSEPPFFQSEAFWIWFETMCIFGMSDDLSGDFAQKSVACDHGVTHSGTSNWLLLCHFCLPLVVVGFRFCFGTALQNWVGNVSPQPQVPSARTGSNPALYRWRLKYFQPLELPRSWWSRGNLTCNDSATGAEIRWDAVRFHELWQLWTGRSSDGCFAMMWVKSETDSLRSFRRNYSCQCGFH